MFTGRSSFTLSGGIRIRHIVLFIVIILLVSTPAASALSSSLSFSAVDEFRAHRQSRFFDPQDVKEESQKKMDLIRQRNALAQNLNAFNRDQRSIRQGIGSDALSAAEEITELNRNIDRMERIVVNASEIYDEQSESVFQYYKSQPETVVPAVGRNATIQKVTYIKAGQVVAVFGEVMEGRDGSVTIKNKFNMNYSTSLPEAQPESYTSVSLNLNSGMVTISEWSNGKYWTEEDVENDVPEDDLPDITEPLGHAVLGKLKSYGGITTEYDPGREYDPSTIDVLSLMKLNITRLMNITSKTELEAYVEMNLSSYRMGLTENVDRTKMRYYTEGDEESNATHIKDQLASYHEIQSSGGGCYSDSPALVSEVDWFNCEYDWAFKHEDDRELVFRPNGSEEYIEDFQLTEVEKEQKRSVSLITGYTEHSEDNIGHTTTLEWNTSISDYDKFGNVTRYETYKYSSWNTDVTTADLDENEDVVVDPETGEVTKKVSNQLMNKVTKTETEFQYNENGSVTGKSENIESTDETYDGWMRTVKKYTYNVFGRTLKEVAATVSSDSPGITTVVETLYEYGGLGEILGTVSSNWEYGTWIDNGEEKDMNVTTTTFRDPDYTEYNNVCQLISYREKSTYANGAESFSWVTNMLYDQDGQVIGYDEESLGSDGVQTRTEVKSNHYNAQGQVVSYTEEKYGFTNDGDLRSRSTTSRMNTTYEPLGRVVETEEVVNKGGIDIDDNETGYYTFRNYSYPRSLFQIIDTNQSNEQNRDYISKNISHFSSAYRILQKDDEGNTVRYERLDHDENGSWVSGSIVDKVVRLGNETRNNSLQFEIARDYVIDQDTNVREFEPGGEIPTHLQEAVDAYLGSLPIFSREPEKIIKTWWTEGFATGDPVRLATGYNSIGQLSSYHEETISNGIPTVSYRVSTTYNENGKIFSYNETGISNGKDYSFIRSAITYSASDSQVTGYDEIGYKTGFSKDVTYSVKRRNMDYNDKGADLAGYHEEGTSSSGEEYHYTRSDIKYFGDSMVGYQEIGEREGESYEFTRSNIVYDGEDRVAGYKESGTDTAGIKYEYDRSILGYDGKTILTYEEKGNWTISYNIPVGKAYWFRVDHQPYTAEAGKVTITTEVNNDGAPVKSFTSYYLIRNGSKIFTDGELTFNNFDDTGRVESTTKYELFYDLKDENDSPFDADNYDVTVKTLEVTKNLEFDGMGNARYVETENYDIEDGADGLQNVEMEEVFSTDLSNIETHLTEGEWQRAYTGDTFTEMLAYDPDGNVLTSEEYNYFVDDSSGNETRTYYEASLVNNVYDSSGRLMGSDMVVFHIDEKDDSPPMTINDSFDIIRDRTTRKYTGITKTTYEDHDGSNAGTVTTENYRILRSVLESDDPESMIRLYDNETGTNSLINTRMVGEGDPNTPGILEFQYGVTTNSSNYDYMGNAEITTVHYYELDENDSKIFTTGEAGEHSYDLHGNLIQSRSVSFEMSLIGDSPLGPEDPEAYERDFLNMKITTNLEYEPSGKYASEVIEETYELENESDELDDVLTEDGRINESAFKLISGSETHQSNFNFQNKPLKVETFNYVINDEGTKEYVDGTLETKTIDEHYRTVETGTYDLSFTLVLEPDSEGNPEKPEPVNGAYLFEDYNVTVIKYQLRQVSKDDNGKYLFDVYDDPLETESKEYDISDDNNIIPGVRTFLDLRNLTIRSLELKMVFIFKDSDGDGIVDLDDECPYQDATGFDADSDGCIDSISGLQTLIGEASDGDVSPKIAKSLLSKAKNAGADLEKGKKRSAVNKLEALVNEIEAQSGKKISKDTAELLIEYTLNIISWVGDS